MIVKNDYVSSMSSVSPNNPVTNNMNIGTQVGRLYGKLNVAVKKEETPDLIILDGNGTPDEDLIYDGNT